MKVYEVLFLFNKQLEDSRERVPDTYRFIRVAYNNVINKIKESHGINENLSKSNINQLNITQHMNNKLSSILTQKINTCDKKKLKKSQLFDELINVAGIGKKKANELTNMGLTDIKQLSQNKWKSHLSSGTIILLKNKPLRRIPHETIKKLERKFTAFKLAKSILVGGFIRKKPFSKDIDVMIVSNKTTNHHTIIPEYIKYLNTQFPEVHVYAKGVDKSSLVIKPKNNKQYLKVDIFATPVKYQHAMLLYAIGSKKHNIKMRGLARRKGYILNQYGLYKLTSPDKPVSVKSERDFFRILGMPYVLPMDR
jgi:DNA polymerase/3'-5' exonuclease PolX